MRTVVTGATGFLGCRVARQLLAAGADVLLSHAPRDPTVNIDDIDAERVPLDLAGDEASMRRLLEGAETLFHVAALVAFDPRRRALQWRVNVDGTRKLLSAARAAGVRRLVYTSTISTLGVPPAGTIGDEDTAYDWDGYRVGYMETKHAAQQLVTAAARELGAVSVLPGTMLGAGDINGNAIVYVDTVARGHALAVPAGGTCFLHVEDAAAAHLLALERGRPGQRYVIAGEPVTYLELFAWIADALGVPAPGRVLPGWLARAAGRLADVPLRASFHGLARAASAELFYSSAKAERELGWTYRGAREAVDEAVDWYRCQREASQAP